MCSVRNGEVKMSEKSAKNQREKEQKNIKNCMTPNKTLAGDTVLSAHRLTDILIFLSVFARLGVWFSRETCGNHTPTSSSINRVWCRVGRNRNIGEKIKKSSEEIK